MGTHCSIPPLLTQGSGVDNPCFSIVRLGEQTSGSRAASWRAEGSSRDVGDSTRNRALSALPLLYRTGQKLLGHKDMQQAAGPTH